MLSPEMLDVGNEGINVFEVEVRKSEDKEQIDLRSFLDPFTLTIITTSLGIFHESDPIRSIAGTRGLSSSAMQRLFIYSVHTGLTGEEFAQVEKQLSEYLHDSESAYSMFDVAAKLTADASEMHEESFTDYLNNLLIEKQRDPERFAGHQFVHKRELAKILRENVEIIPINIYAMYLILFPDQREQILSEDVLETLKSKVTARIEDVGKRKPRSPAVSLFIMRSYFNLRILSPKEFGDLIPKKELDDLLEETEEFRTKRQIPELLQALYYMDGILANDIVFTDRGWEAVNEENMLKEEQPIPQIRRF